MHFLNDTKTANQPGLPGELYSQRLPGEPYLLYRIINSVEGIDRLQDLNNCQNGPILGNLSLMLVNAQL